MRKNPLIIVAAAIVTIAVVGAIKYSIEAAKCENKIVVLTVPVTGLPYKTEQGQQLSIDGIPRGRYKISTDNSEITQIELSAVMLDANQNLIKQVLMVGGNFPDDAEFELSDRSRPEIIRPTRVVDRVVLRPSGSNTKFIYLFAPPQLTRWRGTRIVAVELDDLIPLDRLSVRRVGTRSGEWVEGEFIPTNEPIASKYARRNEQIREDKYTYIYGASDYCPKE